MSTDPEKLSKLLLKQFERRSLTNRKNAQNRKYKSGEEHPQSKYTRQQIQNARAIRIAQAELGARANYGVIASLSGVNIRTLRDLLNPKLMTKRWPDAIPTRAQVNHYKEEYRLFEMSKAKWKAAPKKVDTFDVRPAPRATFPVKELRECSHIYANDYYAAAVSAFGFEPDTLEEFFSEEHKAIANFTLDADYARRNRRLITLYKEELFP